jgi:WD40 repeat protein
VQSMILVTKLQLLVACALLAGVLSGCVTTPGREEPLSAVVSTAFSPDGKLLAVTTARGEVALFDPQPLRFRRMLSRDADIKPEPRGDLGEMLRAIFSPLPLAFSPDGALLAAAGVAGGVVVWDVASGDEKFRAPTSSRILDVVFLPLENELVVVGPGVAIRSGRDGEHIGDLALPDGATATAATASPDGQVLIVGLSSGGIAIFDAINRTSLRTLKGHEVAVTGLAFRPDGTAFASTAGGYDLRMWRRDTEGEFSISGLTGMAPASALGLFAKGQGGRYLLWLDAILLDPINIVVEALMEGAWPWAAEAESRFAKAARTTPYHCGSRVTFSANGRYLASTANLLTCPDCFGGRTPEFVLFVTDIETGATTSLPNTGCSVSISPDGRITATAGGAAPKLLDRASGQPMP